MQKKTNSPILNLNHESFLERYNNKEVTLLVDKSAVEIFCNQHKNYNCNNIIQQCLTSKDMFLISICYNLIRIIPTKQFSQILQNLKSEVQAYIDKHFNDEVVRSWDWESSGVLYQIIYTDSDLEPTFSQTLFKLIKEKGISETDCYKNANVDRRLFSKIRSNKNYQPRKNTVFALIIGLKLNLDEAKKLLDSAGYSISHSIKQDLIMEYVIKKQIFDILQVNEILYSFDCPILGTK